MATTDIITGQFVRISQTPASIGDRVVARLIDMLVLFCYLFSAIEFYNFYGVSANRTAEWLIPLLILLPAMSYTFLCEMFFHGQTIGKHIRHIRTVKVDGSTPTMGALLLRWMLNLIDIYFYCIGLLFIACTRKHQRLGDLAAGTMVVQLLDYKHLHITLDEFDYAPRNYHPVYVSAQRLSVGQVDIIRKTIDSYSQSNQRQIDTLADKVRCFLEIEQQDQDSLTFLTTLLHDYQYYALELV